MTLLAKSNFRVAVEATGHRGLWRVSMTTNGYQWVSLPISFEDRNRASRVADCLRVELAPEAEREEREQAELVAKWEAQSR